MFRSGCLVLALMLGSCTSDDPKDEDTDIVDTDTVETETETETDDTDPVDTIDETDSDLETDTPPLDTDTDSPLDSADSSPPDTFDPDSTFVPTPDTQDSSGGGGGETGSCPSLEVLDCNDECFNELLLGDGICHDGTRAGDPDFDCEEHGYDGGDCLGDTDDGPCPDPLDIRDCDSVCYPLAFVGDGSCDDGSVHPYGSPNFQCALFSFDDGDCAVP